MWNELSWCEPMVKWVLIEILARDSLGLGRGSCLVLCIFGFWGCFRVWRDLIRGGGLVDQDWW